MLTKSYCIHENQDKPVQVIIEKRIKKINILWLMAMTYFIKIRWKIRLVTFVCELYITLDQEESPHWAVLSTPVKKGGPTPLSCKKAGPLFKKKTPPSYFIHL
jgi:hypothetical protein